MRDAGAAAFWAAAPVLGRRRFVGRGRRRWRWRCGLDPYRASEVDLLLGSASSSSISLAAIVALRLALPRQRQCARAWRGRFDGLARPRVGWFFIPLANLFMPYMTVRDIWRASGDRATGRPKPRRSRSCSGGSAGSRAASSPPSRSGSSSNIASRWCPRRSGSGSPAICSGFRPRCCSLRSSGACRRARPMPG